MSIGVVDYGVGNLRSVRRGLEHAGAEVEVTADQGRLASAAGIVLPGVGAFAPARQKLRESGLDQFLVEQAAAGKPILGVCLGYQLLFEASYEDGYTEGLGLLPGPVRQLRATADRKVPHMGWNRVRQAAFPTSSSTASPTTPTSTSSTATTPRSRVVPRCWGVADYGRTLTAVARRGSVAGTQFHPEKSGGCGLRLYANFVFQCQAA